jgi:predicted ATPase
MINPRIEPALPVLKKLSLNRFCGFSAFEVEFQPFTVLVGPNNGGKSTILRAIKMGCDAVEISLPHFQEEVRRYEEQLQQLVEKQKAEIQRAQQDSPQNVQLHAKQHRADMAAHQQRHPSWLCDLTTLVKRQYIRDPMQMYFGHRTNEQWTIDLSLKIGVRVIDVSVSGHPQHGVVLSASRDETAFWDLLAPDRSDLLEALQSLRCSLVEPTHVLVPSEESLPWPQMQRHILDGKAYQVWRNQLHWLYEGTAADAHQRVAGRVQEWLNNVRPNLPSRTRDPSPRVAVTYQEGGAEFELAESGAGLRTLLGIAAWVELGPEGILLFDEPDAHLHSSLQRQVADFLETAATSKRQIILATHGPDMIDQFSVDSLVWVDRLQTSGRVCDDAAKTLVDLGALTHAEALNLLDARAILYFESKTDRKVIQALMATCAKESLLSACQVADLQGIGDATHLPHHLRLLEKLYNRKIAGVVIRDADYTSDIPKEPEGALLTCALPCKEIENLLLMQPKAIARAAEKALTKRGERTPEAARAPSAEQVGQFIDKTTQDSEVRRDVENRWIISRLQHKGVDPGILSQIREDFEKKWKDAATRRRICSGKKVLKRVKRWLQEEYIISFPGPATMFEFYEPPPEIRTMFDRIEEHMKAVLGDKFIA